MPNLDFTLRHAGQPSSGPHKATEALGLALFSCCSVCIRACWYLLFVFKKQKNKKKKTKFSESTTPSTMSRYCAAVRPAQIHRLKIKIKGGKKKKSCLKGWPFFFPAFVLVKMFGKEEGEKRCEVKGKEAEKSESSTYQSWGQKKKTKKKCHFPSQMMSVHPLAKREISWPRCDCASLLVIVIKLSSSYLIALFYFIFCIQWRKIYREKKKITLFS